VIESAAIWCAATAAKSDARDFNQFLSFVTMPRRNRGMCFTLSVGGRGPILSLTGTPEHELRALAGEAGARPFLLTEACFDFDDVPWRASTAGIAKRKQHAWDVIRPHASAAKFIGYVEAPTKPQPARQQSNNLPSGRSITTGF